MARDTPTTEINITFDKNLIENYYIPEYPRFEICYYIENEEGNLELSDYDSWIIEDRNIMIEEIEDGYVENLIIHELDEEFPIVKVVLLYVDNKMYDGEEVQVLYNIYN